MRDFHSVRKEYDAQPLSRKTLSKTPLDQFLKWYDEAIDAQISEANSFCLATVGQGGRPTTRTVLLKSIFGEQLIFYTNYESRKAKHLEKNPYVSATFFWKQLMRQVHIEGRVKKVSAEISDDYFKQRPKSVQIGAIASSQSFEISSRQLLENRYETLCEKYASKDPKRPDYWGGYSIEASRFEFWQGRQNRLHDRFVYTLEENSWQVKRLYP